MFPEMGVLGKESEAGESQSLSEELRFGVDELSPEGPPEGGLRLCLPTLRRFLRSENSSPCCPSPGLGGKLCIDGEEDGKEDEPVDDKNSDNDDLEELYLAGRDDERTSFEDEELLFIATSRKADTALLLREEDDFLQLRSMGSVCISIVES